MSLFLPAGLMVSDSYAPSASELSPSLPSSCRTALGVPDYGVLGIAKASNGAGTMCDKGVPGRTSQERRGFRGLLCWDLVTPVGLISSL